MCILIEKTYPHCLLVLSVRRRWINYAQDCGLDAFSAKRTPSNFIYTGYNMNLIKWGRGHCIALAGNLHQLVLLV